MRAVSGASSSFSTHAAAARPAKPHPTFSHEHTVEAQLAPVDVEACRRGAEPPRFYYAVDRVAAVDPRYGKPARTTLGGVHVEDGRTALIFCAPDLARVDRARFEPLTPEEHLHARRMRESLLAQILTSRDPLRRGVAPGRITSAAARATDVAPRRPDPPSPPAAPAGRAAPPRPTEPARGAEFADAARERESLARQKVEDRTRAYAFAGGAGCVLAAAAFVYAHASRNFADSPTRPTAGAG